MWKLFLYGMQVIVDGMISIFALLLLGIILKKVAEYAAIAERYEAVPLQSEQVYCPYAKVVVHATYMFKDEKSLNDFASECNK